MNNILLAELGLLGSPIAGFLLYQQFKKDSKFFLCCVAAITLLGVGRLFNITFKGDLLDLILPIGVYILYCYFTSHSLLINNTLVRISAFIVGFTPVAVGYIFATLGILGVFFVFGVQEAVKTVDINPRYYYREYGFGNATTSWD